MSSQDQQRLIFASKQLEERRGECPRMSTCPPPTNSVSSLLESSSKRGGSVHACLHVLPQPTPSHLRWQAARREEGGEVSTHDHMSSQDQQHLIFAEERGGE